MRRLVMLSCLALAAVNLSGCASMSSYAEPSKEAHPAPAQGKAMVVFFRDTFIGSAIQADVFDLIGPNNDPKFIGLVFNKTKVAYQADPGDHMFMVTSEAADFAAAHLEAGKTYYVLVEPRMGIWKARFSLEPIHKAPGKYSLSAEDFPKWMEDAEFVDQKPAAQQWFDENKSDIMATQKKYWNDWVTDDQDSRNQHTLLADDGN